MKGHSLEDVEKPPTRGEELFYAAVRLAIHRLAKLWFRVEIVGKENIPATGPFILSGVHRSNLDTPISCIVTSRRMRYMGKDTLWGSNRLFDRFLDALGGFPVNRGTADREALRKCQLVLERGEPLVMFPEGTRQSGPIVQELYDGPAFVAARTGAPIVPLGMSSCERAMPIGSRWIRPVKLVLKIGEPLPPPESTDGKRPSRRQIREHTALLRTRIQEEFDAAQALEKKR